MQLLTHISNRFFVTRWMVIVLSRSQISVLFILNAYSSPNGLAGILLRKNVTVVANIESNYSVLKKCA
jgi:hypothetical protein